jgi:hypothetical protein
VLAFFFVFPQQKVKYLFLFHNPIFPKNVIFLKKGKKYNFSVIDTTNEKTTRAIPTDSTLELLQLRTPSNPIACTDYHSQAYALIESNSTAILMSMYLLVIKLIRAQIQNK